MKLVLIGPVYPYRGGIAHYTTLLAKHLAERHQVWVVSFRRQYPKLLFPGRTDRDPSKRVLKVKAYYILDPLNPLTWWQTTRFICDKAPDGVIMQWWVPFWAPAWWVVIKLIKDYTKILMICHNTLPHEGNKWLNNLNRRITRLVLNQADELLAQAKTEAELLKELVPAKSVKCIPFPSYAELATAFDSGIGPDEAKATLGLAGQPVLLFFGFVRPYKGLNVLLEAMPQIIKTTGAKLVIAGEFWEDRNKYEELIKALNIKEWVQIIDRYIPNEELPIYFKAADVVVFPYLSATQSAAISLALGFGTSVVATKVGGIIEAIRDRENGWLVEPGNVEALSAACIEALRQRNNTRARSLERTGWDSVVKKIEQVLEQQRTP
ncbi:glycosyl transferase family 1 [Candidatus Woesearchaeota archaeon]|nr:MAG: glycosyl transferase family 1 [Candidatus Woesearchaeota archaeon]